MFDMRAQLVIDQDAAQPLVPKRGHFVYLVWCVNCAPGHTATITAENWFEARARGAGIHPEDCYR